MSGTEHGVLGVLAPRLAAVIGPMSSVLVAAPPEYLPSPLAQAAFTVLHGEGGFARVRLPHQAAELAAAREAGTPLLVEVDDADEVSLAALEAVLEQQWAGALPGGLLVVCTADVTPPGLELLPFAVQVDHQALTAHAADVHAVHPVLADDPALLREVVTHTGGVPELLAAGDVTDARHLYEVARACVPWAERIHDEVLADPLLGVHLWVPDARVATVRVVASEVAGRALTDAEVSDALRSPAYAWVGPEVLGLPRSLALALQHRTRELDRAVAGMLRRGVIEAIGRCHALPALERVRLLCHLGDWDGANQMLGPRLHLLAAQGEPERRALAALLPAIAPRRLSHLATARQFLAGQWRMDAVPAGASLVWLELAHLLRAGEPGSAGSRAERTRQRAAAAIERRIVDLGAGRAEAASLTAWGMAEAQRLGKRGLATNPDDAALLVTLLLGAVDTCLMMGDLPLAQQCLQRAQRLSRISLVPSQAHPVLWPELLARAALLASRDGLSGVARARLAEYDELVAADGERDAVTAQVARIARRHADLFVSPGAGRAPHRIDPDQAFAAHEAEIEALRTLVWRGPEVATTWMRTFMARAALSQHDRWVWWPVTSLMALLEARLGRPASAARWAERSPLPGALEVTVRAAIELAEARPSSAARLCDEVLASEQAPMRWRMLATGLLSAAQHRGGTPLRSEVEEALAMEEASATLPMLAFLPGRTRTHLAAHLPPEVRELPGLRVDDVEQAGPLEVRLTPRQREVLEALAGDGTLADIARDLYVGVETVRTTAKQLYRRMGVSDRASAVQAGRAMRII